jgi:hypothetical protein
MNGVIQDPSLMGQVETCQVETVEKVKKPRASRAKPKIAPDSSEAPKVAKPRKKKGKAELSEAKLPEEQLPEVAPVLTRETEKKPRGRPPVDKFATVSARIRGGEFTDDSGNKAKLAIYVSRVLAEEKAFRPQMKELLTELGHVDLLSVFALR